MHGMLEVLEYTFFLKWRNSVGIEMILFRDISIFLQIVIFIKITNFLFETFDEVAEVNLKFQIERWQEYFW